MAVDQGGQRLVDRPLPNDEQALRALRGQLAGHGLPVVVVDQPASIGALPVAVAQAMGLDTAYLPGLAMRRIADLHPGEAKTDARDAFVIADAARTLPHTLRSVDIAGPALADLAVLVGYDDDLRDQVTAGTNRIRNLLPGIHPALERALGADLTHPAVLALLARYGGPIGTPPPTVDPILDDGITLCASASNGRIGQYAAMMREGSQTARVLDRPSG